MSKVREALKRAQEERLVGRQPVENENGAQSTEAPSEIAAPAPTPQSILSGAPRSQAVRQGENEHGKHKIAATPAPLNASVLSREPAPVAPTFVLPALEHRPHGPAVGRDPKTGQFLRFEDLLRSCAKPAWALDPRMVVFCESNRQVSGTEQFRTLRTRLYHLRETSPLKKILVTSAIAGEGKTFVATNLAQAIARERDRRVLLIDADLRSPSLHLPLTAPLSPGLSDYLCDQASDADIIQHGQEGNLCFIAAGKPASNQSELLSNGGFEKLLDRLTPLFDWVIVDTPPCLPVADANMLAGLCDGTLLVVRARSTPSGAAERARRELQKRRVVGVVLNAVEEADSYGSYYSYATMPRDEARPKAPTHR